MTVDIKLEKFSGPLDLLLHLIKSQEMDICDIRIVEITEQYLTIIDQMKQLDLDVAGEFLVMAAQLIHIKSRMLLPVSEELAEEEGEDPRAELVKRLLEYQRYKQAAQLFDRLPQLERDIFLPQGSGTDLLLEDAPQDAELTISLYQLANAFHQLMTQVKTEVFHEVIRENLSVSDYIAMISRRLTEHSRICLRDFFQSGYQRTELVVTFLALLELTRMRMIRIEQVNSFSDIWLTRVASADQLQQLHLAEETLDYE
ncbi:MAG TPA: segregation/condensation protein A [Pelovirga sp.]|nr:segregation/condensation protein A [Pelovirga sp.]